MQAFGIIHILHTVFKQGIIQSEVQFMVQLSLAEAVVFEYHQQPVTVWHAASVHAVLPCRLYRVAAHPVAQFKVHVGQCHDLARTVTETLTDNKVAFVVDVSCLHYVSLMLPLPSSLMPPFVSLMRGGTTAMVSVL